MFPLEFRVEVNRQETRVMGLSSSEDRMIVAGVVLAWYRTVTVRRSDGQTESIIATTALCFPRVVIVVAFCYLGHLKKIIDWLIDWLKVDDTNRKRVCNFLLVGHCDYGPVLHGFWDMATYWLKIAYFSFLTPLSFGALAPHVPCGILRWR